jgi:hypothetical protein
MTNTPTTTLSIERLPKDQTIVIQTPTESHVLLAKPLFNALHLHFPDASFEVLETLLAKNAAFGLHIARQHHFFAVVSIVEGVKRLQLQ